MMTKRARSMEPLTDEDGIDGPFVAMVEAPHEGARFRDLRTDRVLEVLWSWWDAGRAEARCRCVVIGGDAARAYSTISAKRLRSPAIYEQVTP